MQARYYDPVIGRFYSNDPVDSVSHLRNTEGIQGFNRYSYAINNPYKYTDPDGRCVTGIFTIPCAIAVAKIGHKIYKVHGNKIAVSATTATVAIKGKNFVEQSEKSINERIKNGEKFSDDPIGLINAENKRKQDFFKKVVPAAGEFGNAASSAVYNGSSLAADALSVNDAANTIMDEIQSNNQTNNNSSRRSDNGMSGVSVRVCSGTGAQKDGCR